MTLPKPPDTLSTFADVSVVIPAFNARETIPRALRSVAEQTLKPREVIVVDDGSTDNTLETARKFESQMKDISLIVIKQENKGAGAARNRALKESSQPIIAFLDADDEWFPKKLERSLHHMDSGNYKLVAHNGYIVEGGQESVIDCAARYNEGSSPYVSLYRKGYIDTCTVVVKKDLLTANGGFDESLPNAQDFDMWLAVLKDGKADFLVFDEVLSKYYVTPGSIMSHTERRLACCLEIAQRYAADLAIFTKKPILSLWFRVLAIYMETAQAYRAQFKLPQMVGVMFRLPVGLFIATLEFKFEPRPPRVSHLVSSSEFSTNNNHTGQHHVIFITLYIWVFVILIAYLYQFRAFSRPIFNILGLN